MSRPHRHPPSSPNLPNTGARELLRGLVDRGVDTVFGYPGGAIMPVYDALFDLRGHLRHVLARHEQGAIHAAQGYARASGRLGVCMVTSGPGATNLVTGIADARRDSTPLLCVTGQVASSLIGTDAFQETDIVGLTASITKWSTQVRDANEIAAALSRAHRLATTGRPGPVLIDFTKDAQLGVVDSSTKGEGPAAGGIPVSRLPSPASLDAAARLIDAAQAPMLVFGQGVALAGAEDELRAFAERGGMPVAATLLGLSAFPSTHPHFVGMVGMHGRLGANRHTNECDLLIAVGMRFDDRVTGDLSRYARQARVIHLDIDAGEIDKHVPTTVAVLGDAKDSLAGLTARIALRRHEAWLARFRVSDAIERARVERVELRGTGLLRMGEVVRAITHQTGGQAVMVSDVGQHQMAVARYGSFASSRSHITSGGLGTMGFGLPAAIGAQLACPERTVICVVGDGGFQMTMQELGTAVQERAAVKIVILDNRALGMVRQWQDLFFAHRYCETAMWNPEFVEISRAYGIPALRVRQRAELAPAIDAMLAHPSAFLLAVDVETDANVFPMIEPGGSVSDVRLEA